MKSDIKFFFELEYKTANVGKIKIFHNSFVEKNRDKCKIIYNREKYEIVEYLQVDSNKHGNPIKIKLTINNNNYRFKCHVL